MRKMFWLFGMLAMVGFLFVACTDEQATGPEDALFAKVKHNCDGAALLVKNEIDDTIDDVLANRRSKKGARQIVDNIARKVCADPPQYMATWNMVEDFYVLLAKQPVDELVGGWDAAADLLALVTVFATNADFLDIPEEALQEGGGFGIVIPGEAKTIYNTNEEAAMVVDEGSFPDATEPVSIAFYRIPDPTPGVPDDPIPGYQAYPEAYDFSGSAQPTGGVEFWMCVVDDDDNPLPVPFESLVIGHALADGGTELLLPPLRDYTNEVLDCTNASPQEPVVLGMSASPWTQFAGQLLRPVAERLLDVEALNAMYFGGKGLGGRGTSFSEFAPVYAPQMSVSPVTATIEFTQSIQLEASISGFDLANSDFTWSVDEFERLIEVNEEGVVTGIGVASLPGVTSEVTVSYAEYSETVQITVVDLACVEVLPTPELVFDRVETYGGFDYYYLSVANFAEYADALFWITNYYEACGLNDTPARTWVDIFEDDGGRLYGYCALDAASGLQSFSYALPEGDTPKDVLITIEDRACDLTAYSNVVATE